VSINPRILVASIFGLILVAAAFIYVPKIDSEVEENVLVDVKNVALLREYIDVKDSDNNTIPDWQERFAFGVIDLDGEEDTLTSKLAGDISNLLVERDALLDKPGSTEQIGKELGLRLALESLDEPFTEVDVTTTEVNDIPTLKDYGNKVAEAIWSNSQDLPADGELEILRKSLAYNDKEKIKELDKIIESYEGLLNDMLYLPVPSTLSLYHLTLINVYQSLLNDIKAFRNVFEDAVASQYRIKKYPEDAETLYITLNNLYLKLNSLGIQWSKSDPASRLVDFGE
jgi:hypothetical protein